MATLFEAIKKEFIDNFNYLGHDGHRKASDVRKFFSPIFDNKEMTKDLERIATVLINKINGIDPHKHQAVQLKEFFTLVKRAMHSIFDVRKHYGVRDKVINGFEFIYVSHDERHQHFYELHPIPPGQMEKSLKKALTCVKNRCNDIEYDPNVTFPSDDLPQKCEKLTQELIRFLKENQPVVMHIMRENDREMKPMV